jgi:hypothetical protein
MTRAPGRCRDDASPSELSATPMLCEALRRVARQLAADLDREFSLQTSTMPSERRKELARRNLRSASAVQPQDGIVS